MPEQDAWSRGYDAGQEAQLNHIVSILESLPFRWDGRTQTLTIDKQELIELIKNS
jgi:hypothetical protein